ncbi:MAG TPA: hypothetical protein VK502_04045 [Candidatus Saccharimonadales bacterium]|nr:hypothetical protein [Candidatus Saccharimonadales bacterium]
MRENNLDLNYEVTPVSASPLVNGADIAFHLGRESLAPPLEHDADSEADALEVQQREAERKQKAMEAFLKTEQGQIGRVAAQAVEMRRAEAAQSEYGLAR